MTDITANGQSLAQKAATAKAQMDRSNPTVPTSTRAEGGKRIPLSVPQRKLEVPDIPGYHLRWIRGTYQRLLAAQNAGFTFVEREEIELNPTLLGGSSAQDGNTDLGNRVSVAEGSEVENNQAVRMYLMKQKMEHYLEDRGIIEERNDSIANALTAQYATGKVGAGQAPGEHSTDVQMRYVDPTRSKIPDLFKKKRV